eukprot:TRINITY_DN67202_c4_g6_i1.p1 TRINITY_DN67202_c4_g6~~TRINITY_DN67202_c4_g6_i1.p1  ORF type:complete len:654 (-),score=54.61 TRINITY_DN67202_c4_g6_i1:258-2219(-)
MPLLPPLFGIGSEESDDDESYDEEEINEAQTFTDLCTEIATREPIDSQTKEDLIMLSNTLDRNGLEHLRHVVATDIDLATLLHDTKFSPPSKFWEEYQAVLKKIRAWFGRVRSQITSTEAVIQRLKKASTEGEDESDEISGLLPVMVDQLKQAHHYVEELYKLRAVWTEKVCKLRSLQLRAYELRDVASREMTIQQTEEDLAAWYLKKHRSMDLVPLICREGMHQTGQHHFTCILSGDMHPSILATVLSWLRPDDLPHWKPVRVKYIWNNIQTRDFHATLEVWDNFHHPQKAFVTPQTPYSAPASTPKRKVLPASLTMTDGHLLMKSVHNLSYNVLRVPIVGAWVAASIPAARSVCNGDYSALLEGSQNCTGHWFGNGMVVLTTSVSHAAQWARQWTTDITEGMCLLYCYVILGHVHTVTSEDIVKYRHLNADSLRDYTGLYVRLNLDKATEVGHLAGGSSDYDELAMRSTSHILPRFMIELTIADETDPAPPSPSSQPPPLPFKIDDWEVEDVNRWISTLYLGKDYSRLVVQHHITGAVLSTMGEHDWEQVGVDRFGDRRTLVVQARRCALLAQQQTLKSLAVSEAKWEPEVWEKRRNIASTFVPQVPASIRTSYETPVLAEAPPPAPFIRSQYASLQGEAKEVFGSSLFGT